MDLANLQRNLPVLVVVLLTWGGVFLYLLRVERLTREIESRIGQREDLSGEKLESRSDASTLPLP